MLRKFLIAFAATAAIGAAAIPTSASAYWHAAAGTVAGAGRGGVITPTHTHQLRITAAATATCALVRHTVGAGAAFGSADKPNVVQASRFDFGLSLKYRTRYSGDAVC